MRHLRIDLQPIEEVLDRLEQLEERIQARANFLDRLIRLDDTTVHTSELRKVRTASRIAKPVNIVFAGGNSYQKSVRDENTSIDPCCVPGRSPRQGLC
jgi:hypothetical protein